MWKDSLSQDGPFVAIHVLPGDLGNVLVGVCQERREPQLLKLTPIRVTADKHVDLPASERSSYRPLLVKFG